MTVKYLNIIYSSIFFRLSLHGNHSHTHSHGNHSSILILDQPDPIKIKIVFGVKSVHKANEVFKVKRGTNVSIICEITHDNDLGNPKGMVQWFNGSSDVAIENVNFGAAYASLSFQALQKADNGSYICRIENEVGRQEKSIQLVVLGKDSYV